MKKFNKIFKTLFFTILFLLYVFVESGTTERFIEFILFSVFILLVAIPIALILRPKKGEVIPQKKKYFLAILFIVLAVGILFYVQLKIHGLI